MAWQPGERSCARPRRTPRLCASRAHVTERRFSHDKTCQGSSSLEEDDRCNAGTSSLGSIFGRYAESKFAERCRYTLDPRPALPMTPAHLPLEVLEICSGAHSKFQPSSGIGETLLRALAHQRAHALLQGCTPEYLANSRVGNFPYREEPTPRRLTRDTQTRPLRSSGHDRFILLHVPSQRVQYRLHDCHRNDDLSAGFLFRLQGYRCVRRRLYLASMPGLGTPFHVSLPNVPSCCHRCPKIWVLPCMTCPP